MWSARSSNRAWWIIWPRGSSRNSTPPASARVEAGFPVGPGQVKFGVQSDGDQLLERYAGINTMISVPVGQRMRVRFGLDSFHEQWNAATIQALNSEPAVPGI